MSKELQLYKLCCTADNECGDYLVDEIGWISGKEFCVWISYNLLNEFIESLTRIFGNGIFDDGGFDANIQETGVCIDLCEAVGCYIDVESVFPREKYQH